MEETSRLDKPLLDSGITLVKRHSLSQLKLPNKSSGAEFSDKSSTPKTPTPTRTVDRLLRNCDAFGLFEELKHVNPFDETFRKAVENKDATFLSSDAPLKGLTQDDDLNTPQYPSLSKEPTSSVEKITDKEDETSKTQTKLKYRRLIKLKSESKRVIRPILPKPVQNHSAKEKLKAFILKDLSPVIVEKSNVVVTKDKSIENARKQTRSSKPTDSNREAAKRYRERVKLLQQQLEEDNLRLRRENSDLVKENTALKKQLRQILSDQQSVQKTPVLLQQIPKILINNNQPRNDKELSSAVAPVFTIITTSEAVMQPVTDIEK